MSGGWVSPTIVPQLLSYGPPKPLTLLDPKFANQIGNGGHQPVGFQFGAVGGGAPGVITSANVGAYDYYIHSDLTIEDNIESYFGATACPHKTDGSEARRAFGMNCAGTVLQSKQTVTNANAANVLFIAASTAGAVPNTSIYATSPISGISSPNTANGSPYQK